MKALLALALLLLLPTAAHAQLDYHDCLQEKRVDNRVSGRVKYVSFKHPDRNVTISGYVLVLLKPRCFDYAPVANPKATADITEVMLMVYANRYSYKMQNRFFKSNDIDERWSQLDDYLHPLIGRYVVVTGQLERGGTIYYITGSQIVVRSIAPCEIVPKSKGVEKC